MKHIKYITGLSLMLLVSSCGEDFLEPVPTSAVSATAYYTTEQQLETAVVNMYDGLQGVNASEITDADLNHATQVEFYLTEMRSDNTRTKSSEGEAAQFESYTITANNGIVSDYYTSFYNIIFRANIVMENLDVASETKAEQFEGEARFVRAYSHFNLVRLFGDIPLINSVIAIDDTESQFTRISKEVVYESIENDLLLAIEKLDGIGNQYKSRASKAAAQALLAKVYLTQGTNYLDAQILCEAVMGSGFALEPNFKDVFYNENNNEVIFSIAYINDNVNDSQNFSAEWLNGVGRTSGVNYVTDNVITDLEAFGGTDRAFYSYRIDDRQPSQNQVAKYLPHGDEERGIAATSSDATSAGNDWIVIRYADVLLMHVEAIMADGQQTSASAALNSFQLVRNRAGLTTPVTNISKEDLLMERRVELAFENQRFFDLVRFGVAQEVLSQFSQENDYSFSATDLLLPMPQREINLSNGLMTQNPGY
ncbi:RagB/SusD family nutrient uptake outer membrane protein [Bizionia sp. KMM 8389]